MRKILLGVFILPLLVFNITLAVSSNAEVKNVIPKRPQTAKPQITVSVDVIECTPEKLTEYGLPLPNMAQRGGSIREKLSSLKRDSDIKIIFSTKVTTYPANKVIVDNRRPLEYLILEEKNGTTVFKKEIEYAGSFFEINPTVTKDGKIVLDYHFWIGRFKGRFSKDKNIPEELGYPIIDIRSSSSSNISLKDGETIIFGGYTILGRRTGEDLPTEEYLPQVIEEERAPISFLSVDINRAQVKRR